MVAIVVPVVAFPGASADVLGIGLGAGRSSGSSSTGPTRPVRVSLAQTTQRIQRSVSRWPPPHVTTKPLAGQRGHGSRSTDLKAQAWWNT
jgi:hypothetical protein